MTQANEMTQTNEMTQANQVLSVLPPELLGMEMVTDAPLDSTRLPYGIVLNQENRCGLYVSEEQAIKAGLRYDEKGLITLPKFEKENKGILLSEFHATILAKTPNYLRYKYKEELEELAGAIAGPYNYDFHQNNKKNMDACMDVAFIFYDDKLQPLNKVPITVRLKNVARWKADAAINAYYRAVELAFYKATGVTKNRTKHDQRWKANILLDFKCTEEFFGPKGEQSAVAVWEIVNPEPSPETIADAFKIATNPELYKMQTEILDLYFSDGSYENVLKDFQSQLSLNQAKISHQLLPDANGRYDVELLPKTYVAGSEPVATTSAPASYNPESLPF